MAAEDKVVMRGMVAALLQAEVEHDAQTGGLASATLLNLRAHGAVDDLVRTAAASLGWPRLIAIPWIKWLRCR